LFGGIFVIIIVVVVVVVGIWLIRVRELGGLTDASQCRAIAENGLDVTVICQHPVYTGCTSPATTNAVTIRILIMKLCRSPERLKSPLPSSSPSSSSTSPSSHVIAVVVVVAGSVVIINVVAVVVVGSWLNRVMDLGRLTDASQCRVVAENGLDAAVDLSAS
jgi:hypothetical protein